MKELKELKLCLDLENQRDRNIYKAVTDFANKHDISDDSEALKAFMVFSHFMGADNEIIEDRITGISDARVQ